MDLVRFPEVNRTYAENQPQYRPLPCYAVPEDREGKIFFCWRLSLWQRLRILFTGRIWHMVMTFNQPLHPQLLSDRKCLPRAAPSIRIN